MRFGVTAGMPISMRTDQKEQDRMTLVASKLEIPVIGSAITPSSLKTVALAYLRTNLDTISVCRTCMTPLAVKIPLVSGLSCHLVLMEMMGRRILAPNQSIWVCGKNSSLAG